MSGTVQKLYMNRVSTGALTPDTAQEAALGELDAFRLDFLQSQKLQPWWKSLLTGKDHSPKGVYLYGPVGRGKTMLMDMLMESLPDGIRINRTHFHRFMLGVHEYAHFHKQQGQVREIGHVLRDYAKEVAGKTDILFFDEFHVVDVADAMILGRLLTSLLEQGVRVVITSNWAPRDLYRGGLQRDRFLPVICMIEDMFRVLEVAGAKDHRRERLSRDDIYMYPLSEENAARAEALFKNLTDNAMPHPLTIQVKGRTFALPEAASGVGRADFALLCEKALGAQDYLSIAGAVHTLILENIPKLTYDRRNEAKRLMILVDVFYEQKKVLIITAAAPPHELYIGSDHAFEFERTISRLLEMQSAEYLTGL